MLTASHYLKQFMVLEKNLNAFLGLSLEQDVAED